MQISLVPAISNRAEGKRSFGDVNKAIVEAVRINAHDELDKSLPSFLDDLKNPLKDKLDTLRELSKLLGPVYKKFFDRQVAHVKKLHSDAQLLF